MAENGVMQPQERVLQNGLAVSSERSFAKAGIVLSKRVRASYIRQVVQKSPGIACANVASWCTISYALITGSMMSDSYLVNQAWELLDRNKSSFMVCLHWDCINVHRVGYF
jgi:hypothetical protein